MTSKKLIQLKTTIFRYTYDDAIQQGTSPVSGILFLMTPAIRVVTTICQGSLTSPLVEEDIQVALLCPLLTAAHLMLVHFDLMFQAELPPEPIADLIASLADPEKRTRCRKCGVSSCPDSCWLV